MTQEQFWSSRGGDGRLYEDEDKVQNQGRTGRFPNPQEQKAFERIMKEYTSLEPFGCNSSVLDQIVRELEDEIKDLLEHSCN
mmetsp:Transcript_23912/g.46882  ORF Transcript_23912/g.46882 Transcript_23912/m.46882 type:complete len:82 (-) Transcript_23912:122-367(-)